MDSVHDIIVNEIVAVLDEVAPMEHFATRRRPTPLYLQRGTLAVMAACNSAARSGSANYRKLRNHASHIVRRDQLASTHSFVSGSVASSGNSAARLWKLANTVLGRVSPPLPSSLINENGLHVSDPELLANTMNCFFISTIERLRDGFATSVISHSTHVGSSRPAAQEDRLLLSPPSPADIIRAISNLNKMNASGVDGNTVSILQLAAPIISMPIAHLIALSFAQAKVQTAFKAAIVVPIHKGREKPVNLPSSYRPVAILPALCKVMEKVVLWQLTPFLEDKLPACQFEFHPARSSSEAIATAHGAWPKATSSGQVTGVAAFDLTAVFDTVDHDILCTKLIRLGIHKRSVKWFRHYLDGRHQRVRYNCSLSPPAPVKCGVPQGSLLDPVLFLVTIHDLLWGSCGD